MGMLVAPFFFYVLAIAFLGVFCSRGLESVQAGEAGFDVRQHLSSSTRWGFCYFLISKLLAFFLGFACTAAPYEYPHSLQQFWEPVSQYFQAKNVIGSSFHTKNPHRRSVFIFGEFSQLGECYFRKWKKTPKNCDF
jgi:hypothetical protein